jgi:hypothetical protein
VVPDIFAPAKSKDGWIELDTDLKVGERVRLITDDATGIHEVLEVAEGKFRTGLEIGSGEVFVYGREVDDFRTVDYEAIAMLNVSATQEIHRRLQRQESQLAAKTAQISALQVQIKALAAREEERDAKFAKLERLLEDNATKLTTTATVSDEIVAGGVQQ